MIKNTKKESVNVEYGDKTVSYNWECKWNKEEMKMWPLQLYSHNLSAFYHSFYDIRLSRCTNCSLQEHLGFSGTEKSGSLLLHVIQTAVLSY